MGKKKDQEELVELLEEAVLRLRKIEELIRRGVAAPNKMRGVKTEDDYE